MNLPDLRRQPEAFDTQIHPAQPSHLNWLLIPIVLAAWWPIATYWMSDDFIALHYAQKFSQAVGDFFGNQYDLPGRVWFYRPLITMSWWLDAQIGGGAPFVAHFNNALVHSINALLLAQIFKPYLGPLKAFACGLVWGLSPSHIAAIQWAVGRVDLHASLWILLTCWLMQGWCMGRKGRGLALCTFTLALMSKETALITPGLVAIILWSHPPRDHPSPGRLRRIMHVLWPMAVILCLYLGLRWLLFGRLGGYDAPWPGGLAILTGLGKSSLNLCNPLGYAGQDAHSLLAQFWPIGFLPIGIGLVGFIRRRNLAMLGALAALYLCACIPLFQLLPGSENIKDLRLFYLPSMALFAVIAAGGPIACGLALLVFAMPMLELRTSYQDQFTANRRTHDLVLEAEEFSGDNLLFISGLGHENKRQTALSFHLGIDRLNRPPFADSDTGLYALRPLLQVAGVNTLPYGEVRGLPIGSSFSITGESILASLPAPRLANLTVQLEGSDQLNTARLLKLNAGEGECVLRVVGHRSTHYRLTLFTAGGYLSCIRENAGPADADDGRIDLVAMLRRGRVTANATRILWMELRVPLALDLNRRLPLLIEAGSLVETAAGKVFAATHANTAAMFLSFDRQFVEGLTGGR